MWQVQLPAAATHMNEKQCQSKGNTNGTDNNVGNAQERILAS